MKNKALFSSKSINWSTPIDFFNKLDAEFHFTLDPCADHSNHKCSKYYTEEDNGLLKDWSGEIVFCNPPYGRQVGKWVQKSCLEVICGGCECVVMLLPARTDTYWFHDYIYYNAEIRFIRGRLKFGGSSNNAPFPCMLAIFRKKLNGGNQDEYRT